MEVADFPHSLQEWMTEAHSTSREQLRVHDLRVQERVFDVRDLVYVRNTIKKMAESPAYTNMLVIHIKPGKLLFNIVDLVLLMYRRISVHTEGRGSVV